MKKIITGIIAGFVMSSAVMVAQATEMSKPHQLILREGPGTHYMTGTKITPNTSFRVGVCNPVWCHIRTDKHEGWVQTAHIVPDFAQIRKMNSTRSGVGGTSGAAVGRKLGSANMVVRMRIISKEEAASRSSRLGISSRQQR